MTQNHQCMRIPKGYFENLLIAPNWPQKYLFIDFEALRALTTVQNMLPQYLTIAVRRAYERETSWIKVTRRVGAIIFKYLYPMRCKEVQDIFGHNGHSIDGKHIDLTIIINGRKLVLLPFSVFTPARRIRNIVAANEKVLRILSDALERSGFKIHDNPTESLQIHCDYIL